MHDELLTTDELAARIKYEPRTIREQLKDSVLIEGTPQATRRQGPAGLTQVVRFERRWSGGSRTSGLSRSPARSRRSLATRNRRESRPS